MSSSDVCIAPSDAKAVAEAARVRGRAVRRVFVVALILNTAVGVMMAIYGYVSHSLSVGTDSLHSILDAGANLLALFGLHWSAAPADDQHPYGRRKIEILAALGIGVLIVIAMFEFAVAAVRALLGHATPPQIGVGGFVVVFVTMLVNALVARYEHRKAHELGSNLLHADAHHTKSDLYASGAVLASFLAVRAGFSWADGVATLVLVALISHVAWEVFSENVPILIDAAVLDPAHVIDVARGMAGVRDVHRVRSRGVHHAVELDLHLQVGSDMSLRAAHALAREIEAQLRVKFPELSDVVIHIEPGPVVDAPEGVPSTHTQT
jgi:cation diffusion facilitator family transporter